ncbi:helix-turn-helix domain-containing protein [Nocardioides fonticola]|uniref:Helix-turn-helix domain-containing protein n=1 Tax=Nocardioides fonticola TaxID=450363 RepID=A0ABP7XMY0_9ACTN
MAAAVQEDVEVVDAARVRVSAVAAAMLVGLPARAPALKAGLAEAVPELRGDPTIVELFGASTESNVESFFRMAQYTLDVAELRPPSAAVEYARRLAQRGISSHALVRSYRVGQQRVLDWTFEEIARQEADPVVAMAAVQVMQAISFDYVDRMAEQVVAEYEAERDRWLANRNTVRAALLAALVDGDEVDVAAGERALGYRLRQQHLGFVVWGRDADGSTHELRRLENAADAVADAVGAVGAPLFVPQDASSGWAWVPLDAAVVLDDVALARVRAAIGRSVRVALGAPASGVNGFRTTHLDALRAFAVASTAGERGDAVVSHLDPGLRAAGLLAADLEAARELVAGALGGLAEDSEPVARLRETLAVFLAERGSYLAAARRLHVHKNTVKYRVDRAVALRGRPLEEDRLDLELALVGCRWLGAAVLRRTDGQARPERTGS